MHNKLISYLFIFIFSFTACTKDNNSDSKKSSISKKDFRNRNIVYSGPKGTLDCVLKSYKHMWIEYSTYWKIDDENLYTNKVKTEQSIDTITLQVIGIGLCNALSKVPHQDGPEYFPQFKLNAIDTLTVYLKGINKNLKQNYGIYFTKIITSSFGEIILENN